MIENPYAHKNYDDLPSLEAIYQTSHDVYGNKNLTLVSLFRESVPLILFQYDQQVAAWGEEPSFAMEYEALNNFVRLKAIAEPTFENLIHKEPIYGAQLHNYKRFMAETFFRPRTKQKEMAICDRYCQDLLVEYIAEQEDRNYPLRLE